MKENENRALEIIKSTIIDKDLSLDLSGLGLFQLPEEIGELVQLQYLDLSNNHLTSLPKEISKLKRLTTLDLSNNSFYYLSDFGFSYPNIPPIKALDISNNQLENIPETLFELNELVDIDITNNPLKGIPKEIIHRGFWAIWNYNYELKIAKQTKTIFEAKLIFVGQGEVGKTSLMKKLKDRSFEVVPGVEKTTHGINIIPWEIELKTYEDDSRIYYRSGNEDVNIIDGDNYYSADMDDYYYDEDEDGERVYIIDAILNIWDFGGQEIYRSTHQLFLTKRSIYVFVWDARREEEYQDFEYWLSLIKVLADESPVLVVMNKMDVRTKPLNESELSERYPNIKGFYQVSTVTGHGLDELEIEIIETFKQLPHIGHRLPKVWTDIRNDLTRKNRDYISYDDYLGICKTRNISEDRANYLSEYYHDLGYMLHYRNDQILQEIVILKPEWATEAFYKLIDDLEIQRNEGLFTYKDLKRTWNRIKYPPSIHKEIVRIIEKFEICFNLFGTDKYIIPQLLSPECPIDKEKYIRNAKLKFEYEFNVMPSGVIPRFICRKHAIIQKNGFWKNGAVIQFDSSRALVISEEYRNKIQVYVTGSEQIELLGIIRNEMEEILEAIKLLKEKDYKELIPCCCTTCKEATKPYYHEFAILKRYIAKGKKLITCGKSIEEIEIRELTHGYQKQKIKDNLFEKIKIAVSELQGNYKEAPKSEDGRNGYVASMLKASGISLKDQTRWGKSEKGTQQGELDIKIESKDGLPQGIFEGLILEYNNTENITKHIKKLFGYDPNGLKYNYMIIYSEARDFLGLWEKYQKTISSVKLDYPLIGKFKDISDEHSYGSNLKIGVTKYNRNEESSTIYHMFLNMNP